MICWVSMDTRNVANGVMAFWIGEPGERMNVIGALLGTIPLTISVFAGNINSDPFHAWMTQELIPKLPLIALW